MADEGPQMHGRLLQTAIGLFAELGYDQTTSRMITDAAGLPENTVKDLFGSKRDLYLAVISHVYEEEQSLLKQMFGDYTHDRKGIHHLIDHYLDYFLQRPQAAALWMHRRMHDAADLREIEKYYSFPQIRTVAQQVGDLFRKEVDVEMVIWSIVWSVQTFVYGGIPDAHGNRIGRGDRRMVSRFRRHLHTSIDPMMLPGV